MQVVFWLWEGNLKSGSSSRAVLKGKINKTYFFDKARKELKILPCLVFLYEKNVILTQIRLTDSRTFSLLHTRLNYLKGCIHFFPLFLRFWLFHTTEIDGEESIRKATNNQVNRTLLQRQQAEDRGWETLAALAVNFYSIMFIFFVYLENFCLGRWE